MVAERVVVLQTKRQVEHYLSHNHLPNDLIIPIGPEALYYAVTHGWNVIHLGELWSEDEYKKATSESQRKIDVLIEALNAYSHTHNPKIKLEIGNYYAFNLWIIIGQIHYNYFVAYSILKNISPDRLLIYTKAISQSFMEFRPDPDCVFADVLLQSGLFSLESIQIQYVNEKRTGVSKKEVFKNIIPSAWLNQFRELRKKWQFRNSGKSLYRLLLIGGVYDWAKICRFDLFINDFSLNAMPILTRRQNSIAPGDLVDILNTSVMYSGQPLYDMKEIAKSIYTDLILYVEKYKDVKRKMKRYDAVVTAVLTYPWDNYFAHVAAKIDVPVIVWQHGEKGQTDDITSLYTELFYSSDYFSYAPAVQRQYQKWVGKNRLDSVEVVGSIGKNVTWHGGDTIVYATGKWFKTAVPFLPISDPDSRLFIAHRTILDYLNSKSHDYPVIFKANNTPGFNVIPYEYDNIKIDYVTPFTKLLETAKLVILDTPATTLVEACSTKVPIFILGGRSKYRTDFVEKVKKHAVWSETPEELVVKIDNYLDAGIYEANLEDNDYLEEYCATIEQNKVVERVVKGINVAINRRKTC